MSSIPTNFWGWITFLLKEYSGMFLNGALISLYLAFVGTLFGCIIGFIVGIVETIPENKDNIFKFILLKIVKILLKIYVTFFRGTPMMAQAMFFYYGAAALFNIHFNPITAGLIIVSINTGAYMAETVRGGIISIEKGQFEGAKAIGMSHFSTMLRVVLPQAFRNIIPQIGNNLVGNIKDTSVLSVIAVNELFYKGRSVSGVYLRYFEVFFIICALYLFMTVVTTLILKLIEKKLDGPSNYKLANEYMDDVNHYTSALIK